MDLYRFQLDEIDSAELKIDEDEELQNEKQFLSSFEKISSSVHESLENLECVSNIYDAMQSLSSASRHDGNLQPLAERLNSIYFELEDIKSEVSRYSDSMEYDKERLDEVMKRIEFIYNLKRKYADTIEGILSFRDTVYQKLHEIEHKEEITLELQSKIATLEKEMKKQAETLHSNRVDISAQQEELINQKIRELCMPHAAFHFDFSLSENFLSTGFTKVNVLFTANKGEDLKPLAKVASGGELSRVLLALKIVQNSNEVSTLIFDEVDEGIGGEVGIVIGKRLRELGVAVQVIAISHLPQVAAKANHHFFIQKNTTEERTVSTVRKLSSDERVEEIARMIYGDEKNETTLKQAKEMIDSH